MGEDDTQYQPAAVYPLATAEPRLCGPWRASKGSLARRASKGPPARLVLCSEAPLRRVASARKGMYAGCPVFSEGGVAMMTANDPKPQTPKPKTQTPNPEPRTPNPPYPIPTGLHIPARRASKGMNPSPGLRYRRYPGISPPTINTPTGFRHASCVFRLIPVILAIQLDESGFAPCLADCCRSFSTCLSGEDLPWYSCFQQRLGEAE